MKPLIFTISLLLICSISYAQKVVDRQPTSTIFVIDGPSGQEVPAGGDGAILFKNAFIDLVVNTNTAKQLSLIVPGRKRFVITQSDPKINGYSFEISLESKFLGQKTVIYTFLYSIDQNTLYFYNKEIQDWVKELVQGSNEVNLNNLQAHSNFNGPVNPQPVQDQYANNTQPDAADSNDPIDTGVTVADVPPALPDYEQPECPEEGFLWQPGYWAYSPDNNDYYWVPGAWVAPPNVGFLWTPPYWGYDGARYRFHSGYWGNTIGFYGGIDYGYGYGGVGFVGGNWYGGHFRYNTAVLRIRIGFHNTYSDRTVIRVRVNNHASFNGRGGIMARPTNGELAAGREHHIMATQEQIRNQRIARSDKTQFAKSSGGGRPGKFATDRVPEKRPNGNDGGGKNRDQNGGNGQGGSKVGVTGPGGRNGANGANGTRPGPGGNGNGDANGVNGTKPGPGGQSGTRPGPGGQGGTRPGPDGQSGTRPGPGGQGGTKPGPGGQGGTRPGPGGQGGNRPGPGGQGGNRPGPGGQGGTKPAATPKPEPRQKNPDPQQQPKTKKHDQ